MLIKFYLLFLFLDPEAENDLKEANEENEESEETDRQTERKVETKTGSGNEIKESKDSISESPVSTSLIYLISETNPIGALMPSGPKC